MSSTRSTALSTRLWEAWDALAGGREGAKAGPGAILKLTAAGRSEPSIPRRPSAFKLEGRGPQLDSNEAKLEAIHLNLYYGDFQALLDVSIRLPPLAITAMIGPSGCGKSTLLRVFNRMNDLIPTVRLSGQVLLDGSDIYALGTRLTTLRKRVGMVFQRPNPFPLSIFQNVAYGPKVHGLAKNDTVGVIVEKSLRSTGLWDDLKDRLEESALALSPEQKQRLCISRLLANEPEVLLMDEPCSTLDPLATAKIEELLLELKRRYTIVIVTHNMQQAARISDFTGYMLLGELIEFGPTERIFTNPKDPRTQDYITGRYG